MEKSVNLSSFDWPRFLETTARNLADAVSEEYVVLVERSNSADCIETIQWREQSLPDLLLDQQASLIVHFAVDNLEDGLICGDGVLRPYVDPNCLAADDEMANESAVDAVRLRLCTGEETALGYRITRAGEALHFQFVAIFCGTSELAPCSEPIDLDAERDFFGAALEAYIERFGG